VSPRRDPGASLALLTGVSLWETNPKDFEIGHGLDGLEDPKIFEAFFVFDL
jgi:hypothetical protein